MKTKTKAREPSLFATPADDGKTIDVQATVVEQAKPVSASKGTKNGRHVAVASAAPAKPAGDDLVLAAARDPSIDVAKMRELVALQREMRLEQAEIAFDDAMTIAQGDMAPIRADASNPQTKSKYASYKALDRVLRPIYTKQGFSISYDSEACEIPDHIWCVALVRRGGVLRKHRVPMPTDGKGAKGGDVMSKTHAVGAAMTYGQRYLLKMIFSIAVGTDDDGNYAKSVQQADAPKIALLLPEEVERLLELCGAEEVPGPGLIRFLNDNRPKGHPVMKGLDDLARSRFKEATDAIGNFVARRKEKQAAAAAQEGAR